MHTVSIGDAVRSLIASKTQANFRPRYVNSLRVYLSAFARGRESEPLASFNVGTVETWFSSRREAPSAMVSNLGRLSALFSFAFRRKWVSENPCLFIEKPRIDRKPPQVFTVRQSAKLLAWTRRHRPDALGWVVLGLLCGLRPEESEQISWDAIDLDAGTICVSAEISKVRARRIVKPLPSALAWLAEAKSLGASLPFNRQRRRRCLRRMREFLKLKRWPPDILRHSCASMWLTHSRDVAKVSHELGNSPGILMRHYFSLTKEEDAARFWGLLPRKSLVKSGE